MATKKKAAVANTKAPAATEKKTAVVNAAVSKPAKTEMVAIFKTTYGYYRYWVKNILADGGIIKYRFIKNPDSYAGVLSVAKAEADKAKKVLAEYKKQNPGTVSMWE